MRKPLSPEATEALHDVMRRACERMEQRNTSNVVRLNVVLSDRQAERLAADVMADFLGANF
jgi:cytochrome P450